MEPTIPDVFDFLFSKIIATVILRYNDVFTHGAQCITLHPQQYPRLGHAFLSIAVVAV